MSQDTSIPNGWTRVALGDVATEYSVRVDNPAESDFERFVGSNHIGRFELTVSTWGSTSEVTSAMKVFQPGDYLLVRRSLYASDFRERAARASFAGVCSGDILTIKENEGVLADGFLSIVLNTPQIWAYIVARATGSITRRIKWRQLHEYEFALPPLEEQRRIAAALSAVRNMEECLARAERYSQAAIRSLIDDAVNNRRPAFREISWASKSLGDLADISKLAGFEYTKHVKYKDDGEVIAIRPLNIKNGQLVLDDVQTIDKSTSDLLPRSKVHAGDVLITYIGAYVGDVLLIEDDDRFHLAPNIARIRSSGEIEPGLLEWFLRGSFLQRQIQSFTKATATPSITMGDIRKLVVRYPSKRDDQVRLLQRIRQLHTATDRIRKHREDIETLQRRLIGGALEASSERT